MTDYPDRLLGGGLATVADAGDDRSPARDRKTRSIEAAPESAPEAKTEWSRPPVRLYGTRWVRDTAAAVAAGKKAKKPISLVRMLGEGGASFFGSSGSARPGETIGNVDTGTRETIEATPEEMRKQLEELRRAAEQ